MKGTRIELCGPLCVEVAGQRVEKRLGGTQSRVLFARLVLAGESTVTRQELADALWRGPRPRDSPAVIRTLLSRLRSALGPGTVDGRADVRLALPDPVWIDVDAASEALAGAWVALDQRDFLVAFERAQTAIGTLEREFLPGAAGGQWLDRCRQELGELALDALECKTLAGSHLAGAHRAQAVQAGRRLVEAAPFRESGYAALMQAHTAGGNRAEAIRVYVGLRDLLRVELGTVPGAAVVALYEQLLAGGGAARAQPAAYEGSPALLGRALDALERDAQNDPILRCELRLELAASVERQGADEQARGLFADAAGLARQLGRGDLLAAAAIGYGGRGIPFAADVVDESLLSMLEEALNALGDTRGPLRVRLLGRLACALSSTSEVKRRVALAEEAVALAHRLGDSQSLMFALSARHLAAWGPDNLDQRSADAVEVIRSASTSSDPEAELPGHLWLFTDRLEAADLSGADRELEAYSRLAAQVGHPGYLWWEALLRAMRHFMAGRFGDAERCAERVIGLAPRPQDQVAAQLITAQVCAVRKEAGELPQLEAAVQGMIKAHPDLTAWRCFLSYLYAEAGELQLARSQFEPLVEALDTLPSDSLWLISVALLADVAAVLGDSRSAGRLYERLAPYQERAVVGLGGLWFGPVEHHLALLARTTREFEAAERHFESAQAMSRRMDARPWLGHSLREHAAALIMRDRAGDHQRAVTLLAQAEAIATELGMIDLQQAIERVRAAA